MPSPSARAAGNNNDRLNKPARFIILQQNEFRNATWNSEILFSFQYQYKLNQVSKMGEAHRLLILASGATATHGLLPDTAAKAMGFACAQHVLRPSMPRAGRLSEAAKR
jgi:hypothetical protein